MEQFIDVSQVMVATAVAVQAVLIMFFILAPIGGAIFARAIESRSTLALILAVMLLVFNLTFVSATYLLSRTDVGQNIGSDAVNLLSLGLAFVIAWVIGSYLRWTLGKPRSQLEDLNEIKTQQSQSDFSFQEKRFQRLKKKKR